jgi:hypothetical protein
VLNSPVIKPPARPSSRSILVMLARESRSILVLSIASGIVSGLNQTQTYDLAELGRYRHYRALMAHWHRVPPPGRIIDVRHEELVGDLAGLARRIIAHCGRAVARSRTSPPKRVSTAYPISTAFRQHIGATPSDVRNSADHLGLRQCFTEATVWIRAPSRPRPTPPKVNSGSRSANGRYCWPETDVSGLSAIWSLL